MPKLNHTADASSINWADPQAAIQIVTAATKQEKAITILVDDKYQVAAWNSVLKKGQDVVDLKKVAEIIDRAVASGSTGGQAASQVGAPDPKVMVIVALTGLFTYLIRRSYAIHANASGSGTSWTFKLDLTPPSSSAK